MDLAQVLSKIKINLPQNTIGFDSLDDCSVYPLDEKNYLIQSVDFFTPIVDDPYVFGKIAATNSVSDIYAMGGTPLYALNIAEFPSDDLPIEILSNIINGGIDVLNKLNIPLLGGHTIKDPIPKYGLVVTGKVSKNNLTLNSNAQPGDILILTKPLGLGIISTSIKKDAAPNSIIDQAIDVMTHINNGAALAMNKVGVNACTDVTGYGLLGHLLEICKSSNISSRISYKSIPLIEGSFELAQKGFIPGGTKRNLDFVSKNTEFAKHIEQNQKFVLADAQTSGGLLISVAESKAKELQKYLKKYNCLNNSIIGKITDKDEFSIYVD